MHAPAAGPAQLRKFGLLVGGVFALIGLWPALVRGEDPRVWALALAALLAGPAAVWPRSLEPVYRGWMTVGGVLGAINTRIILGVMFYLIVTPMGLVMQWMGRDPMRRAFDAGADTYRVPAQPRPGTHMTRQF